MVLLVTVVMVLFVGILGTVLCCKRSVAFSRHFINPLLAQLLTTAV